MSGERAAPAGAPGLESAAGGEPLRVGVMLDSLVVPAWVERILEQVDRSTFTTLATIVVNAEEEEDSESSPGGRLAKLRDPRRVLRKLRHPIHPNALYARFEADDADRNRSEPDAFRPVDVSSRYPGATRIRAIPLSPKPFEHRFDPDTIRDVRAERLDVVLRFGFKIIRGEILDSARHGVWSFHHGDNRYYRGGPALFWEIVEGSPVSGTVLQILTEELDGGRVIYRSQAATNRLSLHQNRNATYWKTAEFAIRRLADLHRDGVEFLESLPTYGERVDYNRGIYRTPRNLTMLRFGARILARRRLVRLRERMLREQWFVAYRRRPSNGDPHGGMRGFRLLVPPHDRFYADPFAVEWGDGHCIFFEDYRYGPGKGVISFVALDGDGRPSEPRVALERDYHLAYPFVFRHGGETYMIPETVARRTVELYRCDGAPDRWTLDRVLLRDIEAVDATLLLHDGRVWLFATVSAPGAGPHDELSIFHADSLEGPWQPHRRNPVVSDVRTARPAGRLFESGGRLIRPAQDCAVRYGHGVLFNEVRTLTPAEFSEKPAGALAGDWCPGNLGTHTYTRDRAYEAVDGRRLMGIGRGLDAILRRAWLARVRLTGGRAAARSAAPPA